MADQNPDTLPTPWDPSGPCPRCGRVSNFAKVGDSIPLKAQQDPTVMGGVSVHEKVDVLRCYGCDEGTVVVTNRYGTGRHWYPAPGSGTLDNQVDAAVASAYDEGMRCLGIGANRAAAVMFRSALSLFVKDKGGEKAKGERHLKSALKHMRTDGSLHSSLSDWADHLNQLGNEGAHPEDYDDVTASEAKELGEFVRHLIRHEYEMPAQLLRSRGLLKEAEAPASPSPLPSQSGGDLGQGRR